jgi:methionine-rich copper-binding protein CopC
VVLMDPDRQRRWTRIAALVVIAALLLAVLSSLATALAASAHTDMVSMTPAAGSTLEEPPTEVVLRFTDEVNPSLAEVSVVDASGRPVASGDARVATAAVTQPLQQGLGPGVYTVAFRVVGVDGHPVSDRLGFTVGPASAAGGKQGSDASPTTASSPSAASRVANWPWAVTALVVLLAAGAGVVALVVRRRAGGDGGGR